MRLTRYTDYALRVLIYVGLKGDGLATIPEIARHYGISRNHLMKVVHELGRQGYVRTVRGRAGGLELARPAAAIGLGEVVRATEDDLVLVECFQPGNTACRIMPACHLRGVLQEALAAFLAVLDRHTLADLLEEPAPLRRLLALDQPTRAFRPHGGIA
jgi:Rrf2 family transcriptional regulator, nitric oxide-sensitive transcriptional repressor